MAKALLREGLAPDRCLVSSAARTRETLAALITAGLVNDQNVQFYDELYLASASRLMDVVQTDFLSQATPPTHMMVLAHNPGLEVLADSLSGFTTGAMPTAAVAHFKVDAADFAVVNTTNTKLQYFLTPKTLP